jgi:hypothetical protein
VVALGGIGVFGLEMWFLGEILQNLQNFLKSSKISENMRQGAAKRLKKS